MFARVIAVGLAGLLILGSAGCKKSEPATPQKSGQTAGVTNQFAAEPPPLVRIHWLGMKHVLADTNGAYLTNIWTLPQTHRLLAQTLDKIAGRSWVNGTNALSLVTNAPAAKLIRPLLDDLVEEESYLVVRPQADGATSTNNTTPAETAIALSLPDDKARIWETNLTAAMQALSPDGNGEGKKAVDRVPSPGAGWEICLRGAGTNVQITANVSFGRSGDWTIIVLSKHQNNWLKEITERISREHVPFVTSKPLAKESVTAAPSNAWLLVEGDLKYLVPWLSATTFRSSGRESAQTSTNPASDQRGITSADTANGSQNPDQSRLTSAATTAPTNPLIHQSTNPAALSTLPPASLYFWATGDGHNVKSHADLVFDKPLSLHLPEWQLPTNLVHDPLIGFSAVRGIRPWLESTKFWQEHQLGTAPDQVFFWAQAGPPFLHFVAAPSADASNQVWKLGDFVLNDVNGMLKTNQPVFGTFQRISNSTTILWRGIPLFSPSLKLAESGSNNYILASLSSGMLTTRAAPPDLWREVESVSNLVYYDWEITGPCVEGLGSMAQLARNVIGNARLTGSAGLTWLEAIFKKLGIAGTAVKQLGPTHLTFTRTSTIGLTGAELQGFADWLESPVFPIGFHTFVAPRPAPRSGPHGTNTNWTTPRTQTRTLIITNLPANALPTKK